MVTVVYAQIAVGIAQHHLYNVVIVSVTTITSAFT
jgi:hypothetical protein